MPMYCMIISLTKTTDHSEKKKSKFGEIIYVTLI